MLPDSLERARNLIRVKVQEALLIEMVNCSYRTTKGALDHMQLLLGNNLWGASQFNMSIDSAIEKAGKMAPPAACQRYHREEKSHETLFSSLEKSRGSAGLCLGCVHAATSMRLFLASLITSTKCRGWQSWRRGKPGCGYHKR